VAFDQSSLGNLDFFLHTCHQKKIPPPGNTIRGLSRPHKFVHEELFLFFELVRFLRNIDALAIDFDILLLVMAGKS
jgi:hypothetical protein